MDGSRVPVETEKPLEGSLEASSSDTLISGTVYTNQRFDLTDPDMHKTYRRHILLAAGLPILALVIGVVSIAFSARGDPGVVNKADQRVETQFAPLDITLSDLAKGGNISVDAIPSLSINGQLKVNNSLTISPSSQPRDPVAGQIYYDPQTNKLRYYDGKAFLSILDGSSNLVQSIGGLTGAVGIDQTLTIRGGQLGTTNTATAAAEPGVLTLQGQRGNISLVAGNGIAVSGTTLSNTGVTSIGGQAGDITVGTGLSINNGQLTNTGVNSLVSASPSLIITDNGDGNLTISSIGGGSATVASPGGTSGRLARFTGAQTIADSIISDTGSLVSVAGDLQVSGSLTLGTLLSVTNGGTGTASLANNGLLLGQGTGPVTSVVAGGAGLCLVSTAGAPAFQACPGSNGVTSLNTLSGALSIANSSAAGSTITIDNASTTQKGIAQFNGTNFSVSSGTVNTAQDINSTASPTFTSINTNAINPSGSMTLGSSSQAFTLQGNASSVITATSGASTSTLGFATPTANVTYLLQSAAAGTYNICTTAGNCVGAGGGVTTSGGTTNRLAKFTGSQTIADSIISDNGSTVSIAGTLAVNTILPSGALTIGSTGQTLTLQGSNTTLSSSNAGITNTVSFATPAGSNKSIVVPNASGVVAVSASGPLSIDAAGNISCAACITSGGSGGGQSAVESINGLTGAVLLANTSTAGNTITLNDASTTQKGIAQFNSANFSVASGVVNTIQDIGTSAAPTFGGITVNGTATATSFSGNGSSLTNLNASNISSGTVGSAYVTGNYSGITGTGALTSGSIGSGFGSISTSSNIMTTLTITGATINATGGYQINGTNGLASLSCSGGQFLQNAVVAGGIVTGGVCASPVGDGTGVTAIGTIDSQTKNANGAVIAGTTLYLQTADATSPGLVSTGTQTFAGSKTFTGNATLFKPGTNSTTAFQIQPAASATPVFNVDTTNSRVGIGTAAPGSPLQVVGRIATSGANGSLRFEAQDNGGDSTTLYSAAGELTFYTGLNIRAVLTEGGRFGVGLNTNPQYPLDVTGDINSSTGYRVNGTAGATTTCTGGQLLQNAVIAGGILTGGSCVASVSGVTTVGTLDSQTKSANGAVISGTSIILQTADATNPGLISTGAQTIAGVKTFSNAAENQAIFTGSGLDTTVTIGGASAAAGEKYITYQNSDTATNAWMVGMDDDETFSWDYGFAGEINVPLMTLSQGGMLGIGTNNPQYELDIYENGLTAGVRIQNVNTSGVSELRIDTDSSSFSIGTGGSTNSETGRLYIYDENAAEYRMTINSSGNVAVGTANANYRLDVTDSKASDYVMRINNTNTANTADGLLIALGVANASRSTGNYFVGFANGSGTVAGKIQGGASAVAYTTTGADYAEYFRANPSDMPAAMELVQIDSVNSRGVVRSGSDSQQNIVGAISDNPGFIGNGPLCMVEDKDCDANYAKYNALVALSGQVPVKVNASHGAIAIGDPITVSTTAGQGAKATKAGYIVGYAQEALNGQSGIIRVLIRPQYFTPAVTDETASLLNSLQSQVDGLGLSLNTGSLTAASLTVSGNVTVQGSLAVAGVTRLKELRLGGHLVTEGDSPVASLLPGAGQGGQAKIEITGNDTAGIVIVTMGNNPTADNLAQIVFNQRFQTTPRIVLTPVGKSSASLQPFVEQPSTNGFTLGIVGTPQAGQTYNFNYHIMQ